MIIVMQERSPQKQIQTVMENVKALGYQPHLIQGQLRTVVAVVGDEREKPRIQALENLPGVEKIVPILEPYKLASKEVKKEKSVVNADGVKIGGDVLVVMAGPCSVESEKQIIGIAEEVKKAGAQILRGGAFKPRTSPYSFQGLEKEGLVLLAKARKITGLKIITEVISPTDVPLVEEYADLLQIGARNMQNFALLKEVGKCRKPILLKRGMSGTIKELLMSAEYILSQGNSQVILCERGIRTFEDYTRNTLDLSAVPVIREHSHLPVIVDPSHGVGKWNLVPPLCKAAVAVGADGLLIEVHADPAMAYSDGAQSLKPKKFAVLMEELRKYAALEGKKM